LELINQYLRQNGVDWEVKEEWYKSFRQRHPELVIRKSIAREEARMKAATYENLKGFYDDLVTAIKKYLEISTI
jgi:hypothetical protein